MTDRLGKGDFATVYEVSDGTDDTFALKWSADRTDATDRLRNEITVLQELAHRGIPIFLNEGVEDGRPYFVMTLAKGDTVKTILEERDQAGGVRGDRETLHFMFQLLGILNTVHSAGWVHRDIKAGNVLCIPSMSTVSLIDFGFAKREGDTERGADDSFWRAGSARYSPPEKLLHPRKAVASHDLFAVGVLAYQLLTGVYPWSVSTDQDAGELREQMLAQPPLRVNERNSLVAPEVSRLVMSLITVSDQDRPSAAEALESTGELREEFAQRKPAAGSNNTIYFPRVVRDPLFGDVRLTDYERDILNTPEMQRLRHVKQLGLTNFVYPGAQHSRLEHAIGSVFRTEQMLRSIEETSGVQIELKTRLVARIYALVHDVTHVAFGHTIEDELGIFERHDSNRSRIERLVLSPKSALGTVLRQNEAGEAAIAHFDDDASIQDRSAITDLVSGSTGADVLDYIDRDAFHCGVDHRIDSAILRQFRLQRLPGAGEERLVSLLFGKDGVRIDREYAVESLLAERYALFLKVYCHKRKNAASAVLDKALSAAIWGRRSARPVLSEEQYEWLPDDVVIDRLRQSTRRSVKRAATRLSRRELPRGVYRTQLLGESSRTDMHYEDRRHELDKLGLFVPEERMKLAVKLAKSAEIDADDVFVYCPPKAPGYKRVKHWLSREPGHEERADDVESVFRDIKGRHLGLWEMWVFCGSEERGHGDALAAAAQDLLGFQNRIEINPRSDRLF